MATERDAELARKRFATTLERLGAAGIAVDRVTVRGKRTFGVIAFFTRRPRRALSKALVVKRGAVTVKVPLVVRVERFRPEIPP